MRQTLCCGVERRARVAWITGSNAVRTPVSDPLERAPVHAYAAGTGATVGPARVGPSAPSNHWIPQCLVRFGETLKATLKKPPCNNTWWLKLNNSSWSSLVSSQGATSPPLPNGFGRGLHGPHLYRDQRDSIWCTANNRRYAPPSAPCSHEEHIPSIPGGTRDPCKLQDDHGNVLQETRKVT